MFWKKKKKEVEVQIVVEGDSWFATIPPIEIDGTTIKVVMAFSIPALEEVQKQMVLEEDYDSAAVIQKEIDERRAKKTVVRPRVFVDGRPLDGFTD